MWSAAIAAEHAAPKDGVKVDPPLSAAVPDEYSRLPLYGSITWEVRKLPWVEDGPYAGISGVAMASRGKQIYVSGGFIPGGDETDDRSSRRTSRWTFRLRKELPAWERLSNVPVRREYTRGMIAADTFFLVGGGCQYRQQDPKYRPHADCLALNISAPLSHWNRLPSLNVARTHMAVGAVGRQLIVAGGNEYDVGEKGYSQQTIRDTTEVFDLSDAAAGWQYRRPLPGPARGWAASTATRQHLYVFGGITFAESGRAVGILETLRYDPVADEWESKTAPPLAISGWEGDLHQGRYALMAGGVVRADTDSASGIIWSDLVWAYDTAGDEWLRVDGVLPPGAVFNDPGVAVIDNTIYILGAEGPHGSHYNYLLVGHIRT